MISNSKDYKLGDNHIGRPGNMKLLMNELHNNIMRCESIRNTRQSGLRMNNKNRGCMLVQYYKYKSEAQTRDESCQFFMGYVGIHCSPELR